jgi:phosphoenolpyruvate carboxykinase (GTP)
MGDYFAHWLKMGETGGDKMPKVFYVNWFRKSPEGKFLWPGYAENSRVLKWIFERCEGTAKAVETPIGNLPGPGGIDLAGLDDVSREDLAELLRVDVEGWLADVHGVREYSEVFGGRVPQALQGELDALQDRLESVGS